ncbi:MAG: hypothetical protein QXO35_01240 [Candidatus Micrarchaeia archaeon]
MKKKYKGKKGQIAFETILIVGFVFLLLIPLIFILFNRSVSIQDELTTIQTSRALFTLVSAVDSVGVLGPNNSIIVEVVFPNNIKKLSIGSDNNREISAVLATSLGDIHIVKMSQFNISSTYIFPEGNIKSGTYRFKIVYSEDEKEVKISLD